MVVLETVESAALSALWFAAWVAAFVLGLNAVFWVSKGFNAFMGGFLAGAKCELANLRKSAMRAPAAPKSECQICGGFGTVPSTIIGHGRIECLECDGTGLRGGTKSKARS